MAQVTKFNRSLVDLSADPRSGSSFLQWFRVRVGGLGLIVEGLVFRVEGSGFRVYC